MSRERAAVVGMLAIKHELIDKHSDPERLTRWIAQSVEVLLECELARIDGSRTDVGAPSTRPAVDK